MDIAGCLQPEDGNGSPADFPPADVPPALVQKPTSDMTRSNMDNDENTGKCAHEEWIDGKFHSRGFVLTTSLGGGTVICRYMTVWILQIASSQKTATVHRRIFRRRMFRRRRFGSQHRT